MRSSDRRPRFAGVAASLGAAVACLAAGHAQVAARQGPPARFTVMADGQPLAVWARVPDRPWTSLVLIHGRTWSSRPDFDLQVPGLERSVLASLAARGVAAYAVDLRGYGASPADSSGWLTPSRAAADVRAVLAWVAARHPQLQMPALLGWSRGAAVAMMVAQSAPRQVSRLVLFGFAFDPGSEFADPELPGRPPVVDNTREMAAEDFVSPDVTPAAVVTSFVEQALAADPRLVALRGDREFNVLAPERVSVPVLLMYGDRDPGVVPAAAARFFARLGTPDKQRHVIHGADHAAHLENTHDEWVEAVVGRLR